MQKIIYSPNFLGSTMPNSMNDEGSEIIVSDSSNSTNICSLTSAIWYGPVQNLSTDSKCSCPNLVKLSKSMSGITYYKCTVKFD